MNEKRPCPYCAPAPNRECEHLAIAVKSQHFVTRCVQAAQAEALWERFCRRTREMQREEGWGELPDFTWIESAFCDEFLKRLEWFGEINYEWRDAGTGSGSGDLWAVVWSKDPQKMWWQLRDRLERHLAETEQWLDAKRRPALPPPDATGSLF
jgi:hypothetical protein